MHRLILVTKMHLSSSTQLLTLFVVSLLVSICLHSEFTSARNNEKTPTDPTCVRKKMPVTVFYHDESENCAPINYKVHYCSGACLSYLIPKPDSPFQIQQCQCCIGEVIEVKRRTLKFHCTSGPLTQDVYIPIIRNCSCIHCHDSYLKNN